MAQAWYDVMGDSSWYHKKFKLVNGNIINSKYADATKVSWGSDSSYLDDADAAILFWHGSEDGDVYKGSMRVDESGGGDCKVREDEMDLGDQDLEFLVLSSCHGLDDNQWKQWWKSFKGLHQLDSFHGLMWISSGRVGDYEDFAEDAFDGPMTMPTTTAKMTPSTTMTIKVRLKISRACGDCGLNTLTTSAINDAPLNN